MTQNLFFTRYPSPSPSTTVPSSHKMSATIPKNGNVYNRPNKYTTDMCWYVLKTKNGQRLNYKIYSTYMLITVIITLLTLLYAHHITV